MLATDEVTVAGIAARDPRRAAEFAEKHRVPFFTTYSELISSPSVDAVYIPLPVGLHTEWALAALSAGKHVLVEKSLAGTFDDCARVLRTARSRNLVVLENFMCERHPQNVWIRNEVMHGNVGRVQHAELSFGFPPFPPDDQRNSIALQGGALNDAGAYCIDMAAYYLNEWPTAVSGHLRRGPSGVDVAGAALLEYASGATASIAFGFDHDYRNNTRLWGQTGQIDVYRCFSIRPDEKPRISVTRNSQVEDIDIEPADQFQLQISYFRDLVNGKSSAASEMTRRAAHAVVMDAVRRSSALRKRVEFRINAAYSEFG